jgi:NAD(P)-dependent dehydrogenase (short-subunit alcohol dehydrogenase family)
VESFTRHWREHALGGFQLAQAAIPVLLRHGGGSLFFTGASASLRGKAKFAPFAAAKGALRNLVQSIAREYGPQNIHVGKMEGLQVTACCPAHCNCRPNADRMACCILMQSPRSTGTCTISTAARGHSSSMYGPGARASERLRSRREGHFTLL